MMKSEGFGMDGERREAFERKLANDFTEAWRDLGARSAPALGEILERYDEPGRAYHSLEHLRDCLAWLEASEGQAERHAEVWLALVYHDVICAPGAIDNEAESAALFRGHADASGLAVGVRERIACMIEGTARHDAREGDAALVNDIDLAILGASPEKFSRDEAAIREEYAQVEERAYRAGRAALLRSFLERFAIYQRRYFAERLEAQARVNLSRALARLEGRDDRGGA